MDKTNALDKLKQLVAIQSVSTDKKRNSQTIKAADLIKNELFKLGFEVKMLEKNHSHPLIIAFKNSQNSKKTIGVYAHYDVQPEDPISEWKTPPYTATIVKEKIFGRGVADDKGHLIQTISAAKNLIKENRLKDNLVFIFEGEEESEGVYFEELVKNEAKILNNIDVFYILDTGMKDKNIPQIFYGLRGIVTFELQIKIGNTDLHSGVYGNRVLNPAQVLADLMAKMKNIKSGKITIPGFYDDCQRVTDEEIKLLSEYIPDQKTEKKNAQIKDFFADFLSSKIYPSLDINGMIAGYTGEGFKTIIPSRARVKFSIRLVPNQKFEKIAEKVKKFVSENLPSQVDYDLKTSSGAEPFYTDFKNEYVVTTATILKEVFNNNVYFNRSGGSIPAAEILLRLFKKPVIPTGFTLPDENIHAPNENIDVEMFYKGIEVLEKIFCQ